MWTGDDDAGPGAFEDGTPDPDPDDADLDFEDGALDEAYREAVLNDPAVVPHDAAPYPEDARAVNMNLADIGAVT